MGNQCCSKVKKNKATLYQENSVAKSKNHPNYEKQRHPIKGTSTKKASISKNNLASIGVN